MKGHLNIYLVFIAVLAAPAARRGALRRTAMLACALMGLLDFRVAAQGDSWSGCQTSTNGSYTVMTFNGNGSFTSNGSQNVSVLAVSGGGGGGGGGFYNWGGGGGGAGGVVYNSSFSINSGTYSVTVGSGGSGGAVNSGNGQSGGNSVFSSITVLGGGYGGGGESNTAGGNGGSGGGSGGGQTNPAGSGTSGQGNSGGSGGNSCGTSGGSGGGATAAGANGTTCGGPARELRWYGDIAGMQVRDRNALLKVEAGDAKNIKARQTP